MQPRSELDRSLDQTRNDPTFCDGSTLGGSARVIPGRNVPPYLPEQVFFRPDVADLPVGDKRGCRLTLVTAPQGYGKSTLLGYWWQQLRDRDQPVKWLGLRRSDTEISLARLLSPNESKIDVAIDALARDTVVFIDGYRADCDPSVARFISFLLDARDDLKVILGTSVVPEIALARLASCNQLTRVGASDLSFDLARSHAFVMQSDNPAVSRDVVFELQAVTEGWPAGIGLILSSASDVFTPEDISSTRVNRQVDRYFKESVFSFLDHKQINQLVRLSELRNWRPDVCEALLGEDYDAALLEGMHERQQFILEGPDGVLRPHAMLRACLQRRQSKSDARRKIKDHARAAALLAAREDWPDAVDHALAAGDLPLAAGWAEHCAVDVANRGEALRLQSWLAALPGYTINRSPKICYAAALTFFALRRPELAMQYLNQGIAFLVSTDPAAQAQDCDLLSELSSLKKRYPVGADNGETARQDFGERYCKEIGKIDPSTSLCSAWFALYEQGVDEADEILGAGEVGTSGPIIRLHRLHLEALTARMAGDFDRSSRVSREFEKSALAEQGADGPLVALAVASQARLHYEFDRCDQIEALSNKILPALLSCGSVEGISAGFLAIIRARLAKGRADEAIALAERLGSFAEDHDLPRLMAQAVAEKAFVQVAVGLIGRAQVEVATLPSGISSEVADPIARDLRRTVLLAQSRIMLATGDVDEAISRLKELEAELSSLGFVYELIGVRALLADAYYQLGQRRTAQRVASQALAVGEQLRLVRTFVDTGPGLIPILRNLRSGAEQLPANAPTQNYLDLLLDRMEGSNSSALTVTAIEKFSVLSQREAEIVVLIAQGLSNKEAGRRLGLSNETVKWHLKNIYDKLGVASRKEATRTIMQQLRIQSYAAPC